MIAVLIAVGMLVVMALPAADAWDAEDVAKIKKKLQEGKGFAETGSANSDEVQMISFSLERSLLYWIDFKAQLCMFLTANGVMAVPCSRIKKGYPLFAPLITWED